MIEQDEPLGVGRRTVSMPQDVLAEVDGRVGAREFSGYVTAAVRRQLQRDKLGEFLAAAEQLDGPIPKAVRAEVDDALGAALSAAG